MLKWPPEEASPQRTRKNHPAMCVPREYIQKLFFKSILTTRKNNLNHYTLKCKTKNRVFTLLLYHKYIIKGLFPYLETYWAFRASPMFLIDQLALNKWLVSCRMFLLPRTFFGAHFKLVQQSKNVKKKDSFHALGILDIQC